MKTKITVKWTAFKTVLDNEFAVDLARKGKIGDAEMTFEDEIPAAMFDEEILDLLFEQTNLYRGQVWSANFEGKMPENRSHTALSIGDQVVIERNDDRSEYVCRDVGWELINFSNEYSGVRDVWQIDQDRMITKMADAEMGDI